MKVVLAAVLAKCPRGAAGHTIAMMNWALALRALGCDVWLAEHLEGDQRGAPDPATGLSEQEAFWRATCAEFAFAGRQCLLVDGESPELEAFREFADSARLFLNYSGQFRRLDLIGASAAKCYLDVDPAFTQLWAATCGVDMNFYGHDRFLTVGTCLGKPGALLPDTGHRWEPLPPPVAADAWRARLGEPPPPTEPWSTVSHWYGYSDLPWEGRTYGGKRASLLALRELPRLAGRPLAIATDLRPDWGDHAEFLEAGWKILPAETVCRDVDSYLRFLSSSRGEIGVAKQGYVVSRCGWVSDRSVTYLALGRPVALQDTGWPRAIEPRPGLLPFAGAEGAAAAIQAAENDYAAHCAGARDLADSVFSPQATLGPLLESVG